MDPPTSSTWSAASATSCRSTAPPSTAAPRPPSPRTTTCRRPGRDRGDRPVHLRLAKAELSYLEDVVEEFVESC
ncbi:hypothetical protein GXW82_44395 [Streptacidiphilus sp. 4-A2]|nr:hypothetical protein [Streptacidiphilus sp. 4-A2]